MTLLDLAARTLLALAVNVPAADGSKAQGAASGLGGLGTPIYQTSSTVQETT